MQKNISKTIFAGLAGTLVMSILMLMAPAMGLPPMPVGAMLANFMGIPIALGWAMHFMIGSMLALSYTFLFSPRIPGNGVVRGILFSVLPWLLSQVAINPMMGAGLFALNTPAPALTVLGSLMGHMFYGAVLGALDSRGPRQPAAVIAQQN